MGFIKICGMTDAAAVSAAVAGHADAIGFVFAPSVRRVSVATALALAQPARGRALCVAVTMHPSAQEVADILTHFQPDVLQTDAEDLSALHLPKSLTVWPVLRAVSTSALAPRVLFEGPRSGTGKVADWRSAQQLALQTQLILAGGLSPVNVAEAIATVKPFGVDVSSGVESQPGRKDAQKVEQFITRARRAFADLPHDDK
jgi:phosphoribosylanthranilate isomerase